jgi:hypothetical protein
MSVPKDVYDFLTDSHPGLANLALWVREAVLMGESDLTERVYLGWDGIGFRHPDGGYVCAIYHMSRSRRCGCCSSMAFASMTARACLREPALRPASSASGNGTMGSLLPSDAMSMTRWRSGCLDGRGPARRLPPNAGYGQDLRTAAWRHGRVSIHHASA